MSYLGITFKDNSEQLELIRLMNENNLPIVFCLGQAGTGKTFTALVAALDLQERRKYKYLIYSRNPVQMGEDMGYLPGGIDDKYDPFIAPLTDNLKNIADLNKHNPREYQAHFDCVPIAFMRGRSFENTIVIIDEAQNLNFEALQTIITRLGKYCKIVLLGSPNQIDDEKQRRKPRCDFLRILDVMERLPYVGKVELTKSMRSEWCTEVDNLLSEEKRKNG